MPDFKKIAAEAKAAHEARELEKTRKFTEEEEAKARVVRAGNERLQADVLPILETAKKDFGAEGLDSKITPDVYYDKASLIFQIISPPRRKDRYRLESEPVIFQSDGTAISVGIGEHSFDRTPKRQLGNSPPGDLNAITEKALRELISLYLSRWESVRHNWQ